MITRGSRSFFRTVNTSFLKFPQGAGRRAQLYSRPGELRSSRSPCGTARLQSGELCFHRTFVTGDANAFPCAGFASYPSSISLRGEFPAADFTRARISYPIQQTVMQYAGGLFLSGSERRTRCQTQHSGSTS